MVMCYYVQLIVRVQDTCSFQATEETVEVARAAIVNIPP